MKITLDDGTIILSGTDPAVAERACAGRVATKIEFDDGRVVDGPYSFRFVESKPNLEIRQEVMHSTAAIVGAAIDLAEMAVKMRDEDYAVGSGTPMDLAITNYLMAKAQKAHR